MLDHAVITSGWTVEVFTYTAPALEFWALLEECASMPVYQTRRFAVPWLDTMGQAAGMTPMIVLIRDAYGNPAALFPFGVKDLGGIRRVEFLGGTDSNSNFGLMRPDVRFTGGQISALLHKAAMDSGLAPDAYILSNQPEYWDGLANPLATLPKQPSPSQCHSAELMLDSEAFQKKHLSSEARRKLRSKRRKLEEKGPVSLITARNREEAERLLEAFFAQKLQRFDEKNIKSGFDSLAARRFFERCCVSRIGQRDASVELHGLLAGDRIVATYGGGLHRGRFHGMINSFDPDPEIARYSPGDLLLGLLMEAKCRQGLHIFDLGIGEGRYKSTWCDHAEPLFDSFMPLTLKGRVFVWADAARRRLKRSIKQNVWAWNFAQHVRRNMRLPG